MPQYLVANYLPDDFDSSTVTEAMIEEHKLTYNDKVEMTLTKFDGTNILI